MTCFCCSYTDVGCQRWALKNIFNWFPLSCDETRNLKAPEEDEVEIQEAPVSLAAAKVAIVDAAVAFFK